MASVASTSEPPSETGAEQGSAEGGVREVLLAGWFLTRRNLLLALWHFLSGMATSVVTIAAVVVVVIALLLPAQDYDMETLGGALGYLIEVSERVQSPRFLLPFLGLVAATFVFVMSVTALVQAGIYGRIAHALQPDGRRTGFWRSAARWFGDMVGYTAIRMLLEAGVTAFACVAVLGPFLLEINTSPGSEGPSISSVVMLATGAAATVVLWALVYTWRMIALGPLFFDGRAVHDAFGEAFSILAARLWDWLRVLGGIVLVTAPIVMIYLAFTIVLTALSAQPRFGMVGVLGQYGVDFVYAVAMSLLAVFLGATFLVRYAQEHGIIDQLPAVRAPVQRVSPMHRGPRSPGRFGRPMQLPGLPPMIVMPLPTRYPNVVTFDEVLGPVDDDAESVTTETSTDEEDSARESTEEAPGEPSDDDAGLVSRALPLPKRSASDDDEADAGESSDAVDAAWLEEVDDAAIESFFDDMLDFEVDDEDTSAPDADADTGADNLTDVEVELDGETERADTERPDRVSDDVDDMAEEAPDEDVSRDAGDEG